MDTTKLLFILKKCITSKSILQGKLIHQKMITLGLQENIALCKNLINLYFSCQYYDHAKLIFQGVENPLDISLWNGLLAAYTKNHMHIEALQLFHRLLRYPFLKPDSFTYPSLLKACGGLGRDSYGRELHAHLIKSGFVFDIVIASSLVGLYAKCNLFVCAIQLFDEMPERDVASWNTVISCYYQYGDAKKALELFDKMRESGFEPNLVTLTTVISSCARLLDLERGKEIHREMMKSGKVLDGFVSSALVDLYGKCGCLDIAKDIFEQMPKKTLVAWNSMISGYSSVGDSRECIELFKRMNIEGTKPTLTTLSSILMACSRAAQLRHGRFLHGYVIRNSIEADIFVNSGLIDLYFKCGRVQSAENVFEMLPRANVVCWNVMISGYVTVGNYFEALNMYDDMKVAGVKPDAVTFSSVLSACSQLAALEKGKEIHNCISERGLESNEIVMGALLDMYAKCGAVDEAYNVFNKLPERDLVSWTSMITAYGSHGQALEALRLFGEMQQSNAKPDAVTFLEVLSACSHAGLVDKGYYYFNLMTDKYGINPRIEHYSCLIDLLGRAGRLREAYNILHNTREITEDVGLLSTLFSACHLHRDLELGEEIAKLLLKKDPDDPSTYITLSNMYAFVKNWDMVRRVRLRMKELGLKKNPGCSWIEIDKRIQSFFVKGQSHPEAEAVHDCLTILTSHMEKDEMLPSIEESTGFQLER
ncbi:hypothetical protein P3X46_015514 [Hevea brasiliensis]|uniref:Pentatricopeptide repeat-containing protein At5g27110 n=1 Tax=Hevea brasiliensis TaxID=3981 RepID=A0ABQ9M075_HEVBR|nr:pentatricopeptide repeat-containing protein At5g27110 [Hevea brasiliensis]KAJ9172253.1 hypothetical protein P3X46_015514 [Hevea brasiliensis]